MICSPKPKGPKYAPIVYDRSPKKRQRHKDLIGIYRCCIQDAWGGDSRQHVVGAWV